ncbi:hypothetical protein [Paraflavitalea speifideaquila]|uniref:hypothetical protein n=1 Tax=Paraflavitalea speifideaquila TaxID=3076558 RepID=UPI0028ED0D2D|nr:hypothetical protein [Paraflavitalea speifideiaquila]
MTSQQVQSIVGNWKMKYTYLNNAYETGISILAQKNNEVSCTIGKAPIAGKETAAEYFFCPGGEFHLKNMWEKRRMYSRVFPRTGKLKGCCLSMTKTISAPSAVILRWIRWIDSTFFKRSPANCWQGFAF